MACFPFGSIRQARFAAAQFHGSPSKWTTVTAETCGLGAVEGPADYFVKQSVDAADVDRGDPAVVFGDRDQPVPFPGCSVLDIEYPGTPSIGRRSHRRCVTGFLYSVIARYWRYNSSYQHGVALSAH